MYISTIQMETWLTMLTGCSPSSSKREVYSEKFQGEQTDRDPK